MNEEEERRRRVGQMSVVDQEVAKFRDVAMTEAYNEVIGKSSPGN